MFRRPPRSTRTDTLFPYTTLFRSHVRACHGVQDESAAVAFPIAVSDPAGAGRLRRQRQRAGAGRSEEHTSELQSLMRISYAVFCLKKTTNLKKWMQYSRSIPHYTQRILQTYRIHLETTKQKH